MGSDNLSWIAESKEYVRNASWTICITIGYDGLFNAWNWAPRLSARASAFSESETTIPPSVNRGGVGVGTLITFLVMLHNRWF